MALSKYRSLATAVALSGFVVLSGCRSGETDSAGHDSFLSSAPTVGTDWSIDESDLVFTSTESGNTEIYFMAGGDTTWVNLTNDPSEDHWPEFSPDGSKIVFYSDRSGRRDIFLMNSDGSGLTQLTNDEAVEHLPAWTPDGRILFTSYREEPSDTARATHVYIMNADGSGAERLDLAGGGPVAGAVMGPDGAIVYGTAGPGRAADLWLATPGDPAGRRITPGDAVYGAPSFSPNGLWLAYHADRESEGSVILIQDLESGAVDTALTGGRYYYPRWSPDGRWLLTCVETAHGNYDILASPIDGSAEPRPIVTGPRRECEARWRPVLTPDQPPAS